MQYTISSLITHLVKLLVENGDIPVRSYEGCNETPHSTIDLNIDENGKPLALCIGPLEQDHCPVCGEEIELADNQDGTFAIYCIHCGPVEDLQEVTEFSETNYRGYPRHWERWCPDCLKRLDVLVKEDYHAVWSCPQCGIEWHMDDTEIEISPFEEDDEPIST